MVKPNYLIPRSLRGRKYSYCESTTTVHFSVLYSYVEPLGNCSMRCSTSYVPVVVCASKERKTVLAVALSRYGYFYRTDS